MSVILIKISAAILQSTDGKWRVTSHEERYYEVNQVCVILKLIRRAKQTDVINISCQGCSLNSLAVLRIREQRLPTILIDLVFPKEQCSFIEASHSYQSCFCSSGRSAYFTDSFLFWIFLDILHNADDLLD